jgi:hypothetical protein
LTRTDAPGSVVIGSRADEHVAAVVGLLRPGMCEVLDAATLPGRRYMLRQGEMFLDAGGGPESVQLGMGCRGWLRRFAPPDWQRGTVLGSQDAAIKTSWLALLAGFARVGSVTWLTSWDHATRAEGKLAQYAAAGQLGIPVPETLVASDPAGLRESLGPRFVLKPLGPSHFLGDDGHSRVVFTSQTGDETTAPALFRLDLVCPVRSIGLGELQASTTSDDLSGL